jgi:hypothetical protein
LLDVPSTMTPVAVGSFGSPNIVKRFGELRIVPSRNIVDLIHVNAEAIR